MSSSKREVLSELGEPYASESIKEGGGGGNDLLINGSIVDPSRTSRRSLMKPSVLPLRFGAIIKIRPIFGNFGLFAVVFFGRAHR